LRFAVFVPLDALGNFSAKRAEPAEKLMHRSKRTNPSAKKPSKDNRQDNRRDRPDHAAIKRPCGERRADGGKRVKVQKPVHRPAAQTPEFGSHRGNYAKPKKEYHKKYLADSAGGGNFHFNDRLFFAFWLIK